MTQNMKALADKFFNDQCTKEEAELVLSWLETDEGRDYFALRMEQDSEEFNDDEEPEGFSFSEEKSASLLNSILSRAELLGFTKSSRSAYIRPLFQIAALALVAVTTAMFFYLSEGNHQTDIIPVPRVFQTTESERKTIRLTDGSRIDLNTNSTLTLKADFMKGSRQVSLEGEAFFQVAPNPDMQFVLSTEHADVTVLGTAFNVKSVAGENIVEVAVTEGIVSFRGNDELQNEGVTLSKGDFAYWDQEQQEMYVESFGAENYLVWRTGRLVFDNMNLANVCVQLKRIYGAQCQFENRAFKRLILTAHLPDSGLENTLSAIAGSLNLNAEINQNMILWSK